MFDYRMLFRMPIDNVAALPEADVFISAFTHSERVQRTFQTVRSRQKVWAVHPHYGLDAKEIQGTVYQPGEVDEADFAVGLVDLLESIGIGPDSTVMVDTTGMMRPELMTLIHLLWRRGYHHVVAVYTEPQRYERKARTEFSRGNISVVRQVYTFEASHLRVADSDLLVLGTGYDVNPMKAVANHKSRARKVILMGLPSLAADMYQENLLRVDAAAESLGEGFSGAPKEFFAGANDPFGTAMTLRALVAKESTPGQNVYFCPLGTKPQVLGFVLFYLGEKKGQPWSVIYPFSGKYNPETARGVGRTWIYELNFACMRDANGESMKFLEFYGKA